MFMVRFWVRHSDGILSLVVLVVALVFYVMFWQFINRFSSPGNHTFEIPQYFLAFHVDGNPIMCNKIDQTSN